MNSKKILEINQRESKPTREELMEKNVNDLLFMNWLNEPKSCITYDEEMEEYEDEPRFSSKVYINKRNNQK